MHNAQVCLSFPSWAANSPPVIGHLSDTQTSGATIVSIIPQALHKQHADNKCAGCQAEADHRSVSVHNLLLPEYKMHCRV